MKIHFAPLQGFTDCVYRVAHHEVCGGVDCYYTPFLRWEKEGVRNKDLRDIRLQNIGSAPTVPQLICNGREELARLADVIEHEGHSRIDINMGCPFPMQSKRGRGAGLLAHPERVEEMAREMECRGNVRFSVKMRLGLNDGDEWRSILPILNGLQLEHIAIHPRVGSQMYKGSVDLERMAQLLEASKNAVVYNGDILTLNQIDELERLYPTLSGVMIGRGLLASPWLAFEYKNRELTLTDQERLARLWELHDKVYRHAVDNLQGESQILSRLRTFWEYASPLLDKKLTKRFSKSGTLRSYREAVAAAKNWH